MATESKHTPGPWRTDGGNICATWEDGTQVSLGLLAHTRWCGDDVDGWQNKRIKRETPHNARLIAAAPDLLAELKAVKAWMEDCCLHYVQPEYGLPSRTRYDAVCAALARAEGGAG